MGNERDIRERTVEINIAGDPATRPFHGDPKDDALHFSPLRMILPDAPRLMEFTNWDVFEGTLLAVVVQEGDKFSMIGSAVLVAPGVAFGAVHVLKEEHEALKTGAMKAACIGFTGHGSMCWEILHNTRVLNSDLCILGLRFVSGLPPDRIFKCAFLTTRLPAVGERLVIAGFRGGANEFIVTPDGKLEITATPLLTSGTVLKMLPTTQGTLVEIDCPLLGGMSGGPVYDTEGRLIGVSRSEWNLTSTYASPMWPALAHPFSGGWPPMLSAPNHRLIDYWPIERADALKLEPNGDGTSTLTYKPWT